MTMSMPEIERTLKQLRLSGIRANCVASCALWAGPACGRGVSHTGLRLPPVQVLKDFLSTLVQVIDAYKPDLVWAQLEGAPEVLRVFQSPSNGLPDRRPVPERFPCHHRTLRICV